MPLIVPYQEERARVDVGGVAITLFSCTKSQSRQHPRSPLCSRLSALPPDEGTVAMDIHVIVRPLRDDGTEWAKEERERALFYQEATFSIVRRRLFLQYFRGCLQQLTAFYLVQVAASHLAQWKHVKISSGRPACSVACFRLAGPGLWDLPPTA